MSESLPAITVCLTDAADSNVTGRSDLNWLIGLCLAAAGLILWLSYPGVLYAEAYSFLDHYLSGRPVMHLLYDSRGTDFGFYQARELSYFFDYVDAQFVALCTRWGLAHFMSLTYLVFTAATVAVVWLFLRRDLKLQAWLATAVVSLYLTSPTVALWSSLGRSAKVGVTLCMALAIRQLFHLRVWPADPSAQPSRRRSWAVLMLLLLAMCLFDRQGAFLAAVLVVWLGAGVVFHRTRRSLALVALPIAALVLSTVYNLVLAPWITHRLNGYWPDMSYQKLSSAYFIQNAGQFLSDGMGLFLDTWRFALGSVPLWAAGALLLVPLVAAFRRAGSDSAAKGLAIGSLVLMVLALLILMDALMVMRHPPVMNQDMRRMYYWVPQTLLLAMGVPLLLKRVVKPSSAGANRVRAGALGALLGLMLLGNLMALPGHRRHIYSEYLRPNAEVSPQLVQALRDLHAGRPVEGNIAVDPAFLLFRDHLKIGQKP